MRLQFDHAALPIYDVEATHAFYTGVLGLPLTSAIEGGDWGGRPWLMMIFALGDGRELALIRLKDMPRPPAGDLPADARHYAFAASSAEELAIWKAKIAKSAARHWTEDHGTQQSIYFEDPNGLILEITFPASPAVTSPNSSAYGVIEKWMRSAGRH